MNQHTERASGQADIMAETLSRQSDSLANTAELVQVKTSEIEVNLARQTEALNQTSKNVTKKSATWARG